MLLYQGMLPIVFPYSIGRSHRAPPGLSNGLCYHDKSQTLLMHGSFLLQVFLACFVQGLIVLVKV